MATIPDLDDAPTHLFTLKVSTANSGYFQLFVVSLFQKGRSLGRFCSSASTTPLLLGTHVGGSIIKGALGFFVCGVTSLLKRVSHCLTKSGTRRVLLRGSSYLVIKVLWPKGHIDYGF